jgi:hypothetical protein
MKTITQKRMKAYRQLSRIHTIYHNEKMLMLEKRLSFPIDWNRYDALTDAQDIVTKAFAKILYS